MLRRLTFLLSPRWLLLYATVAVAAVAMVLLGRWQLQRAHQRHGDLQNYSYVLQWWAFSMFVVFMLGRVIRDAVRQRSDSATHANSDSDKSAADLAESVVAQSAPHEAGYRRYVPPTSVRAEDAVQLDYNNYLASLGGAAEDDDKLDNTQQQGHPS